MNATEWECLKQVRAINARALHETHPYLVPDNGNSLVTAAKNVRIELARAFPSVKFKVRTSRFSMGNSLDVTWTDGPTSAMVDAIAGKYAAGSFDGQTDSYSYEHNAWRDAFGDAKYVSCARSFSPEFVARTIDYLGRKYGGDWSGIKAADYLSGRAMGMRVPGMHASMPDAHDMITRAISRRATCVPQDAVVTGE